MIFQMPKKKKTKTGKKVKTTCELNTKLFTIDILMYFPSNLFVMLVNYLNTKSRAMEYMFHVTHKIHLQCDIHGSGAFTG